MVKRSFSASRCIVVLLFLYAVDLFDQSGVLISTGIFLFFLLYLKEVKVDHNALILLVFSVSYFLSVFFYEGYSFDGLIKYAICPWTCYLLAYNLMQIRTEMSVTKFSELMFLGFFLHGILNLAASIIQYGVDFNNPFRLAYDFWQNRRISVTTASLYYTPTVLLSIGWLFSNKGRARNIIAILIITIGFFATVLYQNRTLILASAIVIVAGVLFLLQDKSISTKKKWTAVVCMLFLGGALCVAWINDMCGIRTIIESTSFFSRLSGANGEGQDRTKIWASFIFGDALKYPFGGNRAVLYNNRTFVHNTWLDVYRRAGILPFFTICVFTISSIRTVMYFCEYARVLEKTEDYRALRLALIGVSCSLFVEPVIEANPYIFYLPIFVIGAMNGRMYSKKGVKL